MVIALIIAGGVLGFDLIMRMQTVITVVTAVLTVIYIIFVAHRVHWATVAAIPAGSAQNVIGALVFLMTGFWLGWVNAAADYSRYLPRNSSSRGVIGWTAFCSSLMLADILLRGRDYSAADLYQPTGRDGDVRLLPITVVVVATVLGCLRFGGEQA